MNKEEYLDSLKKEDILYMLLDYIYNYQDLKLPEFRGKDLWDRIQTLVLTEII
jgi:hypothetical protein